MLFSLLSIFPPLQKIYTRFNWFLLSALLHVISFYPLSFANSCNIHELLDLNFLPCYNLHVFMYMNCISRLNCTSFIGVVKGAQPLMKKFYKNIFWRMVEIDFGKGA